METHTMAGILDAWAWLHDQTDQTEISEIEAVERLIWYLNAGGKRDWRVAEKPDDMNDEEPTPDFLLEEVQHGDLLTVEAKRILPSGG
jgi:hypothetical protein